MFFAGWSDLIHTLVVGTLAYLALVFLLRISGKRTLSRWNAFDFVVTIAFGSMLATALLSSQTSLTQVTVGFTLLILLQLVITWLSVRSRWFDGWIKSPPTLLLHHGRLREDAMRRCRVSEVELLSTLRARGINNPKDVEAVVLESNGTISVIRQSSEGPTSTLADVIPISEQAHRT